MSKIEEKIVVVASGGFDPLHVGHIDYLREAKENGDYLVVLVNTDKWLLRKKGFVFMPLTERIKIIENLKFVDEVLVADADRDDSVSKSLEYLKNDVFWDFDVSHFIFANGGDRTKENIPEMNVDGYDFIFNVGGKKIQSSSELTKPFSLKAPEKTQRSWGHYSVHELGLKENYNWKIKELVVEPGHCLSYQRHTYRSEFWLVKKGSCQVIVEEDMFILKEGESIFIDPLSWHQIINSSQEQVIVHEVQYGEHCDENDIERKL